MTSLSFEDVFSLLESDIQEILRLGQQSNRDFLTNRYVATVLLANSRLLNSQDYECAKNPRFQELYLNEDALRAASASALATASAATTAEARYTSRFAKLRSILNCSAPINLPTVSFTLAPPLTVPTRPVPIEEYCDEDAIRRAIDRYGQNILYTSVAQLEQEFGKNAFNSDFINTTGSNFDVSYYPGMYANLQLFIVNVENFNDRMEQFYAGQPWWEYSKCLTEAIKSNPRTQPAVSCDEDAIRRAIDRYGRNLLEMFVRQLQTEFGQNAFNEGYLNELFDYLNLTRMSRFADIQLSPITFNAIQQYRRFETGFSGEDFWNYTKCLLRVLQSDPRTRERVPRSTMPDII